MTSQVTDNRPSLNCSPPVASLRSLLQDNQRTLVHPSHGTQRCWRRLFSGRNVVPQRRPPRLLLPESRLPTSGVQRPFSVPDGHCPRWPRATDTTTVGSIEAVPTKTVFSESDFAKALFSTAAFYSPWPVLFHLRRGAAGHASGRWDSSTARGCWRPGLYRQGLRDGSRDREMIADCVNL